MLKREDAGATAPSGDDDFVTKTNRSRKKISKAASSDDAATEATATAPAASTSGNGSAAASEGISLRPRTMFTVKGRGRAPEADATPAYRPQWSKDGDGFVSNTPSTSKDGDNSSDAGRRKGKVVRYSKDELLALHVEAETPPQFLVETAIASEISLPPVATLPFDYEELYKQWALNKNRGRGRGRTTTGNNNEGGTNASERSRSNGKWDETKWDKPKRGDDRHNGDDESSWGRGTNGGDGGRRNGGGDIWDDVGAGGGDSMELDLSSMAIAAEKFRREMDAMRDEEHGKRNVTAVADDMDAFDQKLEHAAATGQFEDSDEEVAWDMPLEAEPARPVEDSPLLFQSSHFDQKLAPTADMHTLRLDEPSFSLGSLSGSTFGLGGLSLEVEVEVQDEWFYLDPQGLQQGPFKTAEMKEWFEAGYFKPNLPIRFSREGTFTPLANNFLQGQLPFAAPPRPSPKINLAEEMRRREQQRILELQQQQQQQQQMIQLQQQQEQQRMLQFNQEEKIRLEMQRLEMARQQQNHMFQQQQQLMHHQQQQQQQQQILIQQQSSWQRSQREGIMSALGIFGGVDNGLGGVKDHFQEQPLQFEQDFRDPRQLDVNNPARVQDSSFSHSHHRVDDPWGASQRAFVEPAAQPGFFGGGATNSAQTLHQEHSPPETSKHQTGIVEDPWKKLASSVVEAPVTAQPKPVEEALFNSGQQSMPPASPERTEQKYISPVKEKSKVSPVKKQPRSSDGSKQTGAWSKPSTASVASTKSLKDIQADEQRELQESLGQDDSNLEHMGAQLKMMLGVNIATGSPQQPVQPVSQPSSAPTAAPTSAPSAPQPVPSAQNAAPSPSPWGRAAPVLQKQSQASKSMREILLEEERLAAERAKRAEAAPTSSHWMNVVAGTAATPAAAPKVSRLGPVPASVLKSTTRQSRASASGDAVGAPQRKSVTTPSKVESDASFWNFGAAASSKASDAPSVSSAANFGAGNIPSEFMGWCAKQVKAINGSDDLTLVEYCATLEDPGEIREYLAAYLGSTPRVSAFATEFIQRKKSVPTPSKKAAALDAAFAGDATDSKKAKRRTKGQKIDPSLLNYSVGS